MLLKPLITGSITSRSSSGSSRSASEVNPETSAKSAVISRRSSGSSPPPSTSRSATAPATKLLSALVTSASVAAVPAAAAASAGAPQWPQKRIPSGFSPPQEPHVHADISTSVYDARNAARLISVARESSSVRRETYEQ